MELPKRLLFLTLLSAVGITAWGTVINMECAGTLKELVAAPAEVTTLTVTGPVDAEDLFFIGMQMTNLTELDLGEATITAFSGKGVGGNYAYPEATFPAGVFAGLPLTSVIFPTHQRLTIGNCAFMNTDFTTLRLPENIDSIGAGAFAACRNLEKATFPAATRIGESVFACCPALREADLAGCSLIPAGTFNGCVALDKVNGAENVEKIGDKAFDGAVSLTEFAFGPGLYHIGKRAFAGTGLKAIDLRNARKLTSLSEQVFADTEPETIVLSPNIKEIESGAFAGVRNIGNMAFLEGVSTVGNHSFIGASLPSQLVFPDGVETIGAHAFAGHGNVEDIAFPSSLSYIGDHAMEGMSGLKSIKVTSLGTPPELGEAVWEGIDPSEVDLVVDEANAENFKNAPQWQDFRFDVKTGTEGITAGDDVSSPVRGRFDGTVLRIESGDQTIEAVRVFDIGGRLLTAVFPASGNVTLETAHLQGSVFVVAVTLPGDRTAALKLSRTTK